MDATKGDDGLPDTVESTDDSLYVNVEKTKSFVETKENGDFCTLSNEIKFSEKVKTNAHLEATAEDDSVPNQFGNNVNPNQPPHQELPETVESPSEAAASVIPETIESPHRIIITFFRSITQPEILERIQHMPDFRKRLSDVLTFGRDPNSNIFLPPPTMSGKYIEIQVRKDRKKVCYIVKNVSKKKRVTVGNEVLFTNDMVQVEGKTTVNLCNDLIFDIETIPGDIGCEVFLTCIKLSDEVKEIRTVSDSNVEMLPENTGRVVQSQPYCGGNTYPNLHTTGLQPDPRSSYSSLNMESLAASLPPYNQQVPIQGNNQAVQFTPYAFNPYSLMQQPQMYPTPIGGSGGSLGECPPPYQNTLLGQQERYPYQMPGTQYASQNPVPRHQNAMTGQQFAYQNPPQHASNMYSPNVINVGQPQLHMFPSPIAAQRNVAQPQTPDSACVISSDYEQDIFFHGGGSNGNFSNGSQRVLPQPQNVMHYPYIHCPVNGNREQNTHIDMPNTALSVERLRQAPSIVSSLQVGSVRRLPTEHAEDRCPD